MPIAESELTLFHNANVRIGYDNRVVCECKPPAPECGSYHEYMTLLHRYLEEVSEALSSPVNHSYSPVSTISKGYDSPAASVLARSIGAEKALTIANSRNGVFGDDSGEAIADILGLETVSESRTAYQASGLDAEKLFYFTGIPEDIYLYPMREHLRSTLLFSGVKGDTMWDRNVTRPVGTWSWDPGGATLQELRLRMNFVQLPPAFFGWRHHRQLIKVNRSPELAPWTLWNDYDRPIPRRIVEEAGVPREMFGLSKKAVSVCIGIDKDQYIGEKDYYISPEFAKLLDHHYAEIRNRRLTTEMALANSIHSLIRLSHRVLYKAKKDAHAGINSEMEASSFGSFKSNVLALIESCTDFRRKYAAPFSRLSFAAQVANRLLASDYRDLD